jgi:hypothetical protein
MLSGKHGGDMRFTITNSTSVAVRAHQRNNLANALWIAMEALEAENGTVTLTDTATGTVYETDEIRKLAADTPAWQLCDWNSPDA